MNVNDFLSVFKEYFLLFMRIDSDGREFCLLPYDSRGFFSNFVKRDRRFTFSCLYDLSRIEIYYNEAVINESYISNNTIHLNDNQSSEISRYLAAHEYGHTFFCDSIYTFKLLFEPSIPLRNDFNMLFLVQLFNEYTAEWHASRKIVDVPDSLITMFLNKLREQLELFAVTCIGHTLPYIPRDLKYFDTYQWYFTELVRVYTYHQWKRVVPLFNYRYYSIIPFTALQLYCEKLFQAFEQLYNHSNREVIILKKLIELARVFSEITLWDLISGRVSQVALDKININLNSF